VRFRLTADRALRCISCGGCRCDPYRRLRAFSLRCKSPGEGQKQHAAFEIEIRELYHQLFSETRVKKDAELGTDAPYERIITSAALRSPFGTYSSPVPYRTGTNCFLFYSFFFEKNYRGRVAKQIGKERNNEQIYSLKNKTLWKSQEDW
jgi:hypothetical protein